MAENRLRGSGDSSGNHSSGGKGMQIKLFPFKTDINSLIFTENLPFILYLGLLGIIYIANSHNAIKGVREYNKMTLELKRVGWENNSTRSELMFNTMHSEVAKRVKYLGLEQLQKPPARIEK